jgi:hypothetical protein
MTCRSIRIATTHHRSDHPPVTLDHLKQDLDMIDHVIIPVYSVYDPRQPPIGRVISGTIVGLEDGEYALDVNVELFGPDFIPECGDNGDKRVAIVNKPVGKFDVWCSACFVTPEKAAYLSEIATILETSPSYRSNTGMPQEDLPVIIISIGMLPFGYIADTISKRLGCEKVHRLLEKLTLMFTLPEENLPESLLIFDLEVADRQGRSLVVEVIMTNPSGKAINSFFSGGLGELNRILPPYYLSRLHPKKIVMNYCEGRFRVLYAIQKQGIPMIPRSVITMADHLNR